MRHRRHLFLIAYALLALVIGLLPSSGCGQQLASVQAGNGAAADDAPARHIVFIAAEDEYDAAQTLPVFGRLLQERYGYRFTVLTDNPDDRHDTPGMEVLGEADLLVLYVRRRALKPDQMRALRAYLDSDRPVLALRTTSHAYEVRGRTPQGYEDWPGFDVQVLGGKYENHHPRDRTTTVTACEGAEDHPILEGVTLPFTSPASLYRNTLEPNARPILQGTIPDHDAEPLLWTHEYKGSLIIYTSLGQVEDFATANFKRLLTNAVQYALRDRDAE